MCLLGIYEYDPVAVVPPVQEETKDHTQSKDSDSERSEKTPAKEDEKTPPTSMRRRSPVIEEDIYKDESEWDKYEEWGVHHIWGPSKLRQYHELPDYMKHNMQILTGYRVNYTLTGAVRSIFSWHNETLNIWTHIVGIFIFIGLLFWSLFDWLDIEQATIYDKQVLIIYVFSATILLLCSSTFHTIHCLGATAYTWYARLDYAGIAVLISGSMFSPMYYMFRECHTNWLYFYLSAILLFAFSTVAMTFHPQFEKPGYAGIRASMFVAMGFFGGLTAPQALYYYGLEKVWPIGWRMGIMAFSYLFGVLIYVGQIPERFFPGKFDIPNSHAIWHCFVLAGALAQFSVCKYCFEHRNEFVC